LPRDVNVSLNTSVSDGNIASIFRAGVRSVNYFMVYIELRRGSGKGGRVNNSHGMTRPDKRGRPVRNREREKTWPL
jgi:hypothetical protein